MSIALMTAAFKAQIPTTQKFVLLALCDCANDQGECYPSVPNLMAKCSLSERAVQSAVAWLEQTGYLSRQIRRGRSTVYTLTPAAGAPPQDVHPRTKCTPPPHHVHPTPARRAPHPRTTCTLNHKRTIREPSGEPISATRATRLPQGWVLPDPWREWAVDLRPDLDVAMVADEFRDYWHGLGGQRATKCDWEATWRNWVRRSRAHAGKRLNKAEALEADNRRVAAEWLRQFQPLEVVGEA